MLRVLNACGDGTAKPWGHVICHNTIFLCCRCIDNLSAQPPCALALQLVFAGRPQYSNVSCFIALPALQVHNVRGPHDSVFYTWLDKIQAVSSYLCSGE